MSSKSEKRWRIFREGTVKGQYYEHPRAIFYTSYEEALNRAKTLVKSGLGGSFWIFEAIAVVSPRESPIKVRRLK